MNSKKINKEDLMKLATELRRMYMFTLAANKIFDRLNEQRTYSYVGEGTAELNVRIFKKYSYFFQPSKEALRIYIIVELAKLFEKNKQGRDESLNIDYVLKRIKNSPNIYRTILLVKDIKKIEQRIRSNNKKIKDLKNYRDKYIAHNDLKKSTYILSRRNISTLLTIARDFIDLIYSKVESASNIYIQILVTNL